MDRVTVKDVRIMFARMCQAAMRVGINSHNWHLLPGSKINGIRWGIHNAPNELGYLGVTAREAQARLYAYALAWEATPYVPSQDLSRD